MKTIVRNMRTLAALSSVVIITAISVSALALVISEDDILVESDIVSAEDITLEARVGHIIIAPSVSVESTGGDTKLIAARHIELLTRSCLNSLGAA